MAPFHFRLENVLAYRTRLEEEAMQTLALAVAHQDALLLRRDSFRKTREEQEKRLCRAELLSPAERWFLRNFLRALEHDLKNTEEDLLQAGEEVDRCRAALIQKAQERSLLDRLKEKQTASHAALELHKEQREFDEAATLRYAPASL
ncbi:MAG: flagellar export protein FliJ [Deltaproteobacteria bacterium]|jgi:flagellar FliJ protein|nr:flagellar export protein FliJ [Deltaproteobacteria bacterium]